MVCSFGAAGLSCPACAPTLKATAHVTTSIPVIDTLMAPSLIDDLYQRILLLASCACQRGDRSTTDDLPCEPDATISPVGATAAHALLPTGLWKLAVLLY